MISLKEQRTILVTGGAGFIGSHLCENLASLGHKIISLDDYSTGSEKNHVEGPEYRHGHTTEIEKHVPEKIDLIFHLGEYSRTSQSFKDVPWVWHSNMEGTFAVFEYCRTRNLPIVYAGSSTKFGDDNTGYLQSPYAWTKAHNTGLLARYGEWFSLSYVITYFYNVYGGRESSDPEYGTLISIYKRLFEEGVKAMPVVKPGTQVRNFTHVEDVVDGLILAAEKGNGDGYCLGCSESFTIEEVARMFKNEIEYLPERPGDRMKATLDLNKSEKELGWKAKRYLKDYIEELKANA